MNPFVDTTVLVDLLRNYQVASFWYAKQPKLNITPIAWMELIQGARDGTNQRMAVRLLSQFTIVDFDVADMNWAMQQLLAYRLSHTVSLTDCMIASVCHRLQVPLYTHNRKHIEPILGTTLTITPY